MNRSFGSVTPHSGLSRRHFGRAVLGAAAAGGLVGGSFLGGGGRLATRASAAIVQRLASPYSDNVFQVLIARFFAEDVNSRAHPALTVEVYTNGSLMPWDRIAPAVMSGELDMGQIRLAWLGSRLPVTEVDTAPFIATTYAEARKLWQASRPVFQRSFGNIGLVPLYAVPWPPVALISRLPLANAGDLAGCRFGANSAMMESFAIEAAATPVRLQPGEATNAFASGRIDAMFLPVVQGLDSGELSGPLHCYEVNAWLAKDAVVMSQRSYESLDTPTQETLLAAAGAAEEHGWQASQQEAANRLKLLRGRGVTVEQPSDALMVGLRAIGKTVARDWLRRAGTDGEDVLRGYRAL